MPGVCLSKRGTVMNINVWGCQRDELWGRLKAALSGVYFPRVMKSRDSGANKELQRAESTGGIACCFGEAI